jgi:hypothetical protein
MFDSLFNFVIILIPLAILIGRFVVQTREKNIPKPPPPRIPVHFEDDENDEDERGDDFSPYALSRGATEYFRGLSQSAVPKAAPASRHSHSSGKLGETLKPHGPGNLAAAANISAPSGSLAPAPVGSSSSASGSLPEQKDFFIRLSHLPPLKQAVVMAEVLGPPKGIT